VCQVHIAVSALVMSYSFDKTAADILFEKAAEKINYKQTRNAQARKSHTKTTKRKLRRLGIKLSEIKRCQWGKPPT
jgi:hypothetical protein